VERDCEKKELLKKITMLDFTATDLGLFLNTHPCDARALACYNETVREADRCRVHYEADFGPLCGARSLGGDDWPWKDEPWPWQASFNFSLGEGETYVGL